jgi:hypothetical protein
MSRITVSAQVYADDILCELSCDELADELLDRLNSKGPHARKDAGKALIKLGLAAPTPEDFNDALDEIENAARQRDLTHFGILLDRLRKALAPQPAPAVLAAMSDAVTRQ